MCQHTQKKSKAMKIRWNDDELEDEARDSISNFIAFNTTVDSKNLQEFDSITTKVTNFCCNEYGKMTNVTSSNFETNSEVSFDGRELYLDMIHASYELIVNKWLEVCNLNKTL